MGLEKNMTNAENKPTIRLGDAISDGLQRTAVVLFRPFKWRKWTCIAVAAMLTLTGKGRANPGFVNYFNAFGRGGAGSPFPSIGDAKTFVMDHVAALIAGVTAAVVVGTIFYLLTRWLNSRGQFMFFDNVVRNDDRVKAPWREHRALGNSLFRLRLVLDLVVFNGFLLIGAVTVAIGWVDLRDFLVTEEYHFGGASIAAVMFAAIASVAFMLVMWVIRSLIYELAVPVMYVRSMQAWPAVKVAWGELFRPNVGACLLYFLFMLVVRLAQAMWMAMGSFVLMIVTCCCVFVVSFIPVLGLYAFALVGLPTLVFERAFKLYFVSQFGEAYRVGWQTAPLGAFPVVLTHVAAPLEQPPLL